MQDKQSAVNAVSESQEKAEVNASLAARLTVKLGKPSAESWGLLSIREPHNTQIYD